MNEYLKSEIDMQKHLLYITKIFVQKIKSSKIRGVTAFWKGKTACISFYFDGEVTEDDFDSASDACGEIIAHFSNGLLEENYIRWDYPKPLPDEQFLAYRREEADMGAS